MTSHVGILVVAAILCAPAIAQDAAPVPAWVEQSARTADHAFSVQLIAYGDLHAARAVRVVDRKTGALVQEIADVDGLDMGRAPARFIRVLDANADGRPDIALAVNDGGSGPDSMENFYLFDPKAGRYAFHQGLSELPQMQVDSKGIITSSARAGCCRNAGGRYRFIRGKLTALTSRAEPAPAGSKTHGKKAGGRSRPASHQG